MSQQMMQTATAVVGMNLRGELAKRRISQRAAGEILGISHASVSSRLAGRTPIDVNELVKLAALLGVSLSTLLDGVEIPEAPALAEVAS